MDRISSLSDPILHHILSFLPTLFVVRTCVLAKRWKDVWVGVPVWYFGQDLFVIPNRYGTSGIDFNKFVDFVLFYSNCSYIDKFSLIWGHMKGDASRVNAWIVAAIRHNVRALDLEIVNFRSFELAPHVFTSGSLSVLKLNLNWGKLKLPTAVCLPKLKILYFCSVTLPTQEQVTAFFSVCPALETLVLVDFVCPESPGNKILNISAPQVKNLIIKQKHPDMFFFKIKLSAPSLEYLELQAYFYVSRESTLINLPSLAKANIDVSVECYDSYCMLQIIQELKSAQSITLSASCIESCRMSCDEQLMKYLESPFHNLKFLELGTSSSVREVKLIKHMLRNSPNIQTLHMASDAEVTTHRNSEVDEEDECFELYHLKSIKICDVRGCKGEVNFVKFLLKSVVAMEKLIITTAADLGHSSKKEELVKIGEMLVSFPRASSNLSLVFI